MGNSELQDLVALSKHNRQAFGSLYDLTYDRIFNFIFRRTGNLHNSQDICTETFINIMQGLHKFTWKNESMFYAWLYKIAQNAIYQYFRDNSKEYSLPNSDFDKFVSQPVPDEEVEAALREWDTALEFKKVQEKLKLMDQKYQDIIHLKFFEDLEYEQISFITGLPVGTLKSHLHRALQQLKESLVQPGKG